MKPHLFAVLAAATVCSQARAATPSGKAKTRASSYQSEAKEVLLRHKWNVVSDKLGALVADKPYSAQSRFSGPGIFNIEFARLTLKFSPRNAVHTKCTAVIVGYGRGTDGRKDLENHWMRSSQLAGPFPLNTPDNTKEIQDMMGEAEKQLTVVHPEYAAH